MDGALAGGGWTPPAFGGSLTSEHGSVGGLCRVYTFGGGGGAAHTVAVDASACFRGIETQVADNELAHSDATHASYHIVVRNTRTSATHGIASTHKNICDSMHWVVCGSGRPVEQPTQHVSSSSRACQLWLPARAAMDAATRTRTPAAETTTQPRVLPPKTGRISSRGPRHSRRAHKASAPPPRQRTSRCPTSQRRAPPTRLPACLPFSLSSLAPPPLAMH